MAIITTVKDLRTRFETKARASHDLDDLYDTLTTARDMIEDEVKLAASEAYDGSQIANPGDDYLTMKNLPSDWRMTNKMVVGIIPYYPIPFKQRIGYRLAARRYYIDPRNKKFALTGKNGSAQAINHWYQVQYTPFTAENESATIDNTYLIWPTTYWPLIIYRAQALFQGAVDGDDVARVIGQAAAAEYQNMKDGLIGWDANQKLQALDGQLGYADQDDRPFDVGML